MKISFPQVTQEIADHHRDDFVRTYRTVFGGPPYDETYTDAEILDVWRPHLEDGVIFLALDGAAMIGLGCSIPLQSAPAEIRAFLEPMRGMNGFPNDFREVWYMSEVGVLKEYRKKGICSQLIRKRLMHSSALGAPHYVMRTAAEGSNSANLYRSKGAVQLPGIQDVSSSAQVTVNKSQSTARVYLHGRCEEALSRLAPWVDPE